MSFTHVLDSAVAVLLLVTIAYCFLLHRRLAELRNANGAMKRVVGDFAAATERAQAGVLSIKTSGAELAQSLLGFRPTRDHGHVPVGQGFPTEDQKTLGGQVRFETRRGPPV